ncbi:TetR/AcrR family transcriptional regulator [Acetobacteraceae bacterium H6797]|nr:TetR/AcrR family transcriptional regulator [Acetobacteraceae bacterium H6797]
MTDSPTPPAPIAFLPESRRPAPPTTEAQRKAEATRTRIADTAESLFRTMGYQKTAVADIARELGMSPANVYRFFPSKSAINEAICARLLGAIAAGAEAVVNGEGSAGERFRRVCHHYFTAFLSSFFREKRMHDMVAAALEEHWEVIDRYIEHEQALMVRLIEEGIASGEFRPGDPVSLADVCTTCVVLWKHPLLLEQCATSLGETPEILTERLDATVSLLLRGLAA